MGSLELIRWNQNREDNRWAPANEIVVCALVPPTTREPAVLKSWRIPKELRYFDRKIQQWISFTCSASILHVMKDSLALYLSLRAVCVCVCVRDKATASSASHYRVYGTSNTATLRIHSDELKNKMIIIL